MVKIKSVTIILENSKGEVLLCKRSKNVSFFPGFYVFPGGKIDEILPDEWVGDEDIVRDAGLRELYEEVGVIAGTSYAIPPSDREKPIWDLITSYKDYNQFKKDMIFVGRRETPPFSKKIYDTAYYLVSGEIVDNLTPIEDGHEIVEVKWMKPNDAIILWENSELPLPPPVLHTLRNLADHRDKFEYLSLIETNLPIGLQTKVELAPGVIAIPFQSNTIPPFTHTNLVIFESVNEVLIVDPGANITSQPHLKEIISSFPSTPKIFITHDHKDHWDGLGMVALVYPDAEVFGHPLTLDRINTNLKKIRISKGNINIGEKKIEVIHAPGHTDGHSVLLDHSTKTIAAGDHVVGFGSAVLSPETGDMIEYLSTCRRIIDLQPTLILPAHGRPNFRPVKLLENYISHRLDREKSILAAINSGFLTLDEIVQQVYQDVPENMWEFAKHNIRLHVRKLVDESQTSVTFDFIR